MLNIILHNSSFSLTELTILLKFIFMPAFFSFIVLTIITFLSEYIQRKNKEKTEDGISLSTLFLALTTITSLLSLYLWIPINVQQEILQPLTEQKTSINQYYDFKKDGKTITAIKKEKTNNLFVSKLTVTIIDEDKQSYQVQYNNEYGRIPKSDIK